MRMSQSSVMSQFYGTPTGFIETPTGFIETPTGKPVGYYIETYSEPTGLLFSRFRRVNPSVNFFNLLITNGFTRWRRNNNNICSTYDTASFESKSIRS